ncbi:response regulator transcription factor [Aneurinibacillus aneurinilyticus]|jgi:DNA-binding response OmpR family regulator|uniref:Response regulator transcription factor n=2 Tax=Aneurinibacillus aneurinilyticus TaxID=1391 RepID=A0A848D048_ANEAE|nr:response regulator transcription factor [Aneurinibacillus aneurinilyticus]ERI04456.1 putative alkaline phosphatase synthesis transcriptional regulatory protein PhoP [Aneurinibacillus aneurinilyticus ATCC 12856]MED0671165.1 response regulator transcription factor [Aneurinibacillus aneurinilyticus]MED0707623.1 response regulator transcription factor [Aneurinibacillus aneurinilyticus]MED0725572.1 response regulator transcription factor [Aneurinibacillus aneurinilyticus]MED0735327.1 response re
MALILIVEDEMPINILISRNLELVGHECVSVYDGEAVLEIIQKYTFDLILLDIMLPKMNGYEVLEIAKEMDIPVIFLTSKSSLSDRVKGLTLGADDYIVKPFEMLELQARVEAVLRRTNKEQKFFVLDNIRIDLDGRQAFLNNELVDITPQEFDLLVALIRNRNIALSREKLLRLAWGYDFEGDTRTVDVHITKLRKKLGLDNYIKTVYKLGYRLEVLD